MELYRTGLLDHPGEIYSFSEFQFCLSRQYYHNISAALPLLLCVRRVSPLKVNLLAFGVIIYKVYRHTAVKKPEISHYENIR